MHSGNLVLLQTFHSSFRPRRRSHRLGKLVLLLKLLAGTPCGQWLGLLSCERHAPGVGEQLAEDMQRDPTGCRASETLRASFGVKSPQTILKRAACLGRYFKWHTKWRSDATQAITSPLPLTEHDVWEFFAWLRDCRRSTGRGYTNAATLLETVRFAEFTLNLKQTEVILESRRLLGFAAIERLNQGSYPTGASIGLGTS